MSEIPSELRYTESHEWVGVEEDGVVKIGITDHAQAQLGDLVFVELPEQGDTLTAGDTCAVVESVKAASDVYCPLTGEVDSTNEALTDAPETLNNDPYGDGWLFAIKLDDVGALNELMDADQYKEFIGED